MNTPGTMSPRAQVRRGRADKAHYAPGAAEHSARIFPCRIADKSGPDPVNAGSLTRHAPPQVVEQVDEKNHVVLALLRFRRHSRHHCYHALGVRGEIDVFAEARATSNSFLGPYPPFVGDK